MSTWNEKTPSLGAAHSEFPFGSRASDDLALRADLFRGRRAVLDVGSGGGAFLDALRERGIPAVGIETDLLSTLALRRRGHEAEPMEPRRVGELPGRFDGIHAANVIEKLSGEEAARFLLDCARKLEPGGLLVIRTANWADGAVRDTAFFADPTNVRPYPPEAIETLFSRAGLRVIDRPEIAGRNVLILAEPVAWAEPAAPAAAPVTATNSAPAPAPAARRTSADGPRVVVEGAFFETHSFAIINREFAAAAIASGAAELSLAPIAAHEFGPERDPEKLGPVWEALGHPLSGAAEVHVRHQFPPNFDAPPSGALVLWQPWEFGAVPKAWIEPIRSRVDEVWVPTTYVARCFERSGIPRERIAVVPYGVDVRRFAPGGGPAPLATKKRFKFLFVGGSLWRKGVDLLLRAYRQAFTRDDDVCLVVKELGAESFYRGQNLLGEIEEMARNTSAPEVLVLREPFDHSAMPSLYAAADCLVHPYRGEGFALPVAEAMACGKPVIVTRGGATDDFVDDASGWRIGSRPIPVNVDLPLAAPGEVLEPDFDALVRAMRDAAKDPLETRRRGEAARRRAVQVLSWDKAVAAARERIAILRTKTPIRLRALASTAEPAGPAGADPMGEMETRLREIYSGTGTAGRRDPAVLDAHRTLARYYADRGEYDAARRHFQRLAEIEPASWEWHNSLGLLAFLDGKAAEAEDRFKKALALNSNAASIHYNFGVLLHGQDRKAEAIASFRRALELGDRDPELLNNLGVLLFETGDAAEAERCLRAAVDGRKDYAEARLNLATVLARSGRTEEARRHAGVVLETAPDHPEALALAK